MSTTPWEKDERKVPDYKEMKIIKTDKEAYTNKELKPFPDKSLIFDELGQMPKLLNEIGHIVNTPPKSDKPDLNSLVYEINSYPDETQYISIGEGSELTFKINNYSDLWTLNQINDALLAQDRTCSLRIPNLIDAQADRRFKPNESSGLKLVCQFLNSLKAYHTIEVFHPHNGEVVEALLERVKIIDNTNFIERVFLKLAKVDDVKFWGQDLDKNLILMSSDAGGFKPLMKLADKLRWRGETYSASKSRKYEDGKSKLVQLVDRQDFGGKDILIIDDICIYGGTFKGLSKLLRERNCGKLFLAVSHMTIQNLGTDAVTNYFDKVYTTNSKFDSYYDNTDRSFSVRNNLEVIDLF